MIAKFEAVKILRIFKYDAVLVYISIYPEQYRNLLRPVVPSDL